MKSSIETQVKRALPVFALFTMFQLALLGQVSTSIDFEPPLPSNLSAMNSFVNGTEVPQQARITNQFQNLGVAMTGAALVPLGRGHATSGVNGIAPIDPTGKIDYRSAITFSFVTPTGGRASTDNFSISTDRGGGSGNTVQVLAYGADGRLVGSTSFVETTGGEQITLRGVGFFESVTVQMTTGNPNTSGIGFDLLSFGRVMGTGGPATLLLNVSSLNFTFRTSSSAVSPQQLSLTSNAGTLPFTIGTSGGSWLTLSSTSGSTPAAVAVTANPNGLAPGTYSAFVVLTAPAALNPITRIPVTLTVIADAPFFTSAGIVNAASFVRGLVPGGMATVFGVNLLTGVTGAEQVAGAKTHKGVTVSVAGLLAPLISVSNIGGVEQISFQTPFDINSGATTRLEVNNNGKRSSVDDVPVYSVQPGIFEILLPDSSRVAAVLHSDYSLVTPLNPARRGEEVSLWLTGAGAVTPPVGTGEAGPVPPALITAPAVVGLNDVGCEVTFAGYGPLLRGVYQLNFIVTDAIAPGSAIRLNVKVGGAFSQYASIAIR